MQGHAVLAVDLAHHEARTLDLWKSLDDLGHLDGVDEHALHLSRLVSAAHPALDAHVRATAGARARKNRGQVPRREADQRIVRIEGRHDDLADFTLADRIAGAGADDLDQDTLVDDHALAQLPIRPARLVR